MVNIELKNILVTQFVSISEKRYLISKSKKEGKDQESIQSSTTHDPGYQRDVPTSQIDITN